MVEHVVQGVKAAVDGAIAWAERKADELGSEQNDTGPYSSPATCMPTDLDAIASGILPSMPPARQYDGSIDNGEKVNEKVYEKEDEEGGEKDKREGVSGSKL
jgi:hypothetical protein